MEDTEIETRQPKHERPKTALWSLFGKQVPKSELVFLSQIILIYTVVITSLVNLTLGHGPDNLWVALLGSCLGYLLPSPRIEPTHKP